MCQLVDHEKYLMRRQLSTLRQSDARSRKSLDYFGVAQSTISENYRSEWHLGYGQSKITLRKRQWNASKRSVPMMIHLGKHMLGQTDKSDPTEADDIIDEIRNEARQQGMAQEPPESDVQ